MWLFAKLIVRGTATPDASVSACRWRTAPALEGGEGRGAFFFEAFFPGSLRPLDAGFRFIQEKQNGLPRLTPQEPGGTHQKYCYDF